MQNIDFSTYYSIDIEANEIVEQTSMELQSNVKKYIKDHLLELNIDPDQREYEIASLQSTEVITCINNILDTPDEKIAYLNQIADRLLKKELAAQEKIKKMKKELQKGGLIITYFTNSSGDRYFVIAKVHFIDVLMEKSFKKEKATPEKEHMLKTIMIPIVGNKISFSSTTNKALITDSTKTKGSLAASFWWKEFLEVVAVKTDSDNTKKAFDKIDSYFKSKFFKKDYKMDYYSCKNSLVSYMKTSPSFTFSSAISQIMGDFSTLEYINNIDEDKRDLEIKKIKEEMTSLNKTSKGIILFDGNFEIDKTIITSKMKQVIKLDNTISLTIDDTVENVRKKIIPAEDGKGKHIKIYSESGYYEFKRKNN